MGYWWCLSVIGLTLTTVAAVFMFFFPPSVTVFTDKGEQVVSWAGMATESGRRAALRREHMSRVAVALLTIGFATQLYAAIESRPRAESSAQMSRSAPGTPPAGCEAAANADDCFRILKKAGSSDPFAAYQRGITYPAYDARGTMPAPPCKNGAGNCEPWERDWGNRHLEPGSVITTEGKVIPPRR